MGLTRAERIAIHKKQERLHVKKNAPSVAELSEGIPTLRSTPEGLVEYVRYNNQLYKSVYTPGSTATVPANPAFHVELEVDEAITDTAETVPFDTIIFDTKSGFNNTGSGTNPYSYTIGKGFEGIYYIASSLQIDNIADAHVDSILVSIAHNVAGTDVYYKNWIYPQANNANFATTTFSVVLDVKEGDYVYVDVNLEGDSSANIEDNFSATIKYSWFEGFKIN